MPLTDSTAPLICVAPPTVTLPSPSPPVNVAFGPPVIFAVNHPNGLIDPLFLLCFAPRAVSFLAKAPLFRIPLVGWLEIRLEAPVISIRDAQRLPKHRIGVVVERLNEIEIAEGLDNGFRTVQVIKPEHPFSDFWWEGGVQGSHPIGWVECFVQQMNHFIQAVLGDAQVSPLAATFEDGYRAVEIADTMVRSWKSGRREKVQFEAA